MILTVDTDFIDDIITVVPHNYLDEHQIRELQIALETKKFIVLPEGRIICEEGLKALPVSDDTRL